MIDTIQLLARVALAATILTVTALAVLNHGQRAPSRVVNAWQVACIAAAEATLIGLAGGWGIW